MSPQHRAGQRDDRTAARAARGVPRGPEAGARPAPVTDRAGTAPTAAPGDVLGDRYIIEGLLARGGMADVHRARDSASHRPVAVKVLRDGVADRERFLLEAQLLAGLDHPNVVRLLDAGHAGDVPFLVMELVDGPTLADRLRRGPLGADEAHRIGCDVARALAHVHARNVIHRDVKPSNILLARDGRALLADFGVARLRDGTRLTSAPATIGTVAYLAPEQIGDAGVTPAADVYALGMVLIEALSGRPAFRGAQHEVLAARMTREPQVPPHLPPPWPGLLRAMTRRQPGVRPSAADVADRIAAPPMADPRIDTAEVDMTAVMGHPAGPAATRVVDVGDTTKARPRHARPGPGDLSRTRLAGGLVAFAVLVAVAVILAMASGGGDRGDGPMGGDRAGPPVSEVSTPAPPTTRAPRNASTTVAATTPTSDALGSPSTVPAPRWPAMTCDEIEARRQAIEEEKHRVQEAYRDDPDTREQLKAQLEDEKGALDALRRTLGC